jgi:DNA repair protein RecO (recombination protein O)
MSRGGRQDNEPAFVLHSHPWQETSLLLDTFSRHHGRLAIIARGARRPTSAHRGLLMAFRPLRLSWFGKGEVRTLHAAEYSGILPALLGMNLMCGFYVNELVIKLLHRDDPHERFFDLYHQTLLELGQGGRPDRILRRFEKGLLAELGYGLHLDCDIHDQSIDPERRYDYRPEAGPCPVASGGFAGRTLLYLANDDGTDPVCDREARQLMRELINYRLNGQELRTRQLLRELMDTVTGC